ncbi:MAG: helix-turn-helix domain-containing protein [Xanthomonadales bacterium]|jgi:AraC-like DNA-binding protein|nr:helix-turn-helix domain-containing protein [Xanthomonadales bacterium]
MTADRIEALLVAVAGASSSLGLLLLLVLVASPRRMPMPPLGYIGGLLMLAGLMHTVWSNIDLARLPAEAWPPWRYGATLFMQSWGFYALLSGVLRPPDSEHRMMIGTGVISLVLALAVAPRWAIPLSLTIGTGFAVHLAVLLYRLRVARRWFRVEAPVLVLFAALGVAIGLAGAATPVLLGWHGFALLYSAGLLLGFLLVAGLLILVPDLALRTQEAVQVSYAQSSLGKVDVTAAAARLRHALEVEQVYRDEDLGLAKLATRVQLSPHQLSELLNTRFELSFSQFVRQHRVRAAARMLIEEPRASVLSVGLSVGFASQSTFYAAFKEETGLAPGEYRRRHLGASPS